MAGLHTLLFIGCLLLACCNQNDPIDNIVVEEFLEIEELEEFEHLHS